jgi:hypothetical protein
MTSILKIHSLRGDDEFSWDPAVNDDRLQRARREYHHARERGYFAYSRLQNGDTRVIDEFDPTAREILMAVPLTGG